MDDLRILMARMPDQIDDFKIDEMKDEIKKNIKEEIKKEIKEKEDKKKLESDIKKYIINEDDMKVLLLMFGSRGNTFLLEKIIEKKKKEKHV